MADFLSPPANISQASVAHLPIFTVATYPALEAIEYPHLANPPIVEAVLHFRVQPREGLDTEVLLSAHSQIAEQYPNDQATRGRLAEIAISQANIMAGMTDLGVQGYRFESENGQYVAQFNKDSFVFSVVRAYDTWENLESEALRLWAIYQDTSEPTRLLRLETRFINEIPVDLNVPLTDYFRIIPSMPKVDGLIRGFTHQYGIYESSTGLDARLLLHHAGATPDGDTGVIILDIAAVQDGLDIALPIEPVNISTTLANLRRLKNKLFFESITKYTVDLFD